MPMEPEVPQFSRQATSDVFGKLDAEIPAIRINSDVLIEIQRQAAACHMTLSEFVRTRLEVKAFGRDHILMMHAKRLDAVVGNAPQEAVTLKVVGEAGANDQRRA